ncbi:cell wall-binding repeat-containing protein [Tessaracoccus sp. MC1627]|uniref:cell wall-binding repeat-containing protein n=1 Tax=Tessaracoccus sp. MC1627 TaxID=2760312 RepID=UPI00160016C8|nr:cell wall-binding repeat-containing protein [Tessaracoccus sp. MC1627]MBB1511507.1 cell wall-binding repeat-containing protein [Tessaracoccus sp. MC1627]
MRTATGRRLLAGAILSALALSSLPSGAERATAAPGDVTVERTAEQRIGGSDRFAVSANLSRWLPGGDGHRVVVASGEVFPDALTVGPLAARDQSRLLLTRAASLPESVTAELQRRPPQEILIVGGTSSVSPAVESALSTIAPVTRIGGADRYEVAAGIAAGTTATHVVIASGELFSDALSAGPLAAKLGAPLLLTRQGDLPASTAEALRSLAPQTVTVLGGSDTISDAVLEAIATAAGATTERIGGADRYAVAATVAQRYFQDADTAVVASGLLFPDGLSGTPLAHSYGAPILLSTGSCAPAYTTEALSSRTLAHRFYLGSASSTTTSPTPCGTSAIRRAVNPPAATIASEIPQGTPSEEAFYFVPHQDDELISMVGGISRDINAGRRIHVYLVNAGYWTGVKDLLCEQLNRCLTNEQITASRNAELLSALERMGVPASNVHFLYVQEELSDAATKVRSAVGNVVAKAGPTAHFRGMSWLDAHPSHYVVGYALRDACVTEGLVDCLFFQSPLYQKRSEALQYSPVVTPRGEVVAAPGWLVAAAAAAYKEDYPTLGRHSIGWRSVPSQIRWIETNTYSWAHGRVWASGADERAAASWIDTHQGDGYFTADARTPASTFPLEEDPS